jgi:hypothetical protein
VRALSLPLFLIAGCGASVPPPAPPATAALVAGGCASPGVPGQLRARLAVEHGELWLRVGGQRIGGAGERCVALDLAGGEHPVTVQARAEGGAGGVGLHVELATVDASGREHRAFALACGLPGRCDRGTLRAWSSAPPRRDPCATAAARGVRWRSGATSDGHHPEEIEVTFRLRSGAAVADPGCTP